MAICYIIGAAVRCAAISPQADDLVIAADGGLRHVEKQGITPDLIVGDFDSLGTPPAGDNVAVYPVEKDDTDVMLALKLGFERGFREFRLLAGTGGRSDHTIANLQALLWLAARGGRGVLVGEGECFTVLRDGALTFSPRDEGVVSVFAFGGEARGVSLTGLQYPLSDGVLSPDFPLGVSNHFTGESARVEVTDGALLICWQGTPDDIVTA